MNNKINNIRIKGFRRLADVYLEITPFMVLIGANGVGKTSLLDAFSLVSASASGTLNSIVSQMGGLGSILTRGKSNELSLTVDMDVPNHAPLQYEVHLESYGTGYSISKEVLCQSREGYPNPFKHINSNGTTIRYYDTEKNQLISPNWEYNPQETSLSQVPKMFQQPEQLRKILATVTQYHALDVSARAPIKLPQQMKPAALPGADGEDLVSYLYYLRETDGERFSAIEDTLRSAFPAFEGLSFPPVAAGMLAMTWKDNNFRKPLYMSELSEGTLRFLWLISLLQSPSLSTITMIDEPEISLHPELLHLLVNIMREASTKTQLIVATHSDRLIRFLKPEEVVVMDIGEGGYTTPRHLNHQDLSNWLNDYSLDEIWRLGQIGGRA